MRNAEITINATISIKVNDDAKAKHHHDNKSRNSHNINGRVIKCKKVNHPAPENDVFFVTNNKLSEPVTVTAREIIVRDNTMFAFDTFILKCIEGSFAETSYVTIKPDGKGGLKQFSNKHGRWYPCSVQNGIYTIANAMDDIKKYDL